VKKINQGQRGISLIEVMVVIAIIVITFWTFLELIKLNLIIQEQSQRKIEAANLAAEAIEVVRSVRDENWDNLASLSTGVQYYPVISGNKWILSSVDPGSINGLYNRWIILEEVYRDANDDISSSGTADANTKKITAYIQWVSRGGTKQINLVSYLTNWPN